MESFDPMTFHIDDEEIETEEQKEDRKGEERRQKIRDELDTRTGRLWTDEWEITDEEWSTKRTSADLPDWTPDMCSRISLERIKIHPGKLHLHLHLHLPVVHDVQESITSPDGRFRCAFLSLFFSHSCT